MLLEVLVYAEVFNAEFDSCIILSHYHLFKPLDKVDWLLGFALILGLLQFGLGSDQAHKLELARSDPSYVSFYLSYFTAGGHRQQVKVNVEWLMRGEFSTSCLLLPHFTIFALVSYQVAKQDK